MIYRPLYVEKIMAYVDTPPGEYAGNGETQRN